jgi:hypothetical protein
MCAFGRGTSSYGLSLHIPMVRQFYSSTYGEQYLVENDSWNALKLLSCDSNVQITYLLRTGVCIYGYQKVTVCVPLL